jgi:hypothetical protein
VQDELGTNSSCAYCHAPTNFVPSMEDMPESCSACKFEVEAPPPTIPESDWANVPCNVCHRVKKGVVAEEYAWLAIPPIDEYEEVASSTELCLKCHGGTDVADHVAPDLSNIHSDYTCTDCHDAHSTKTACQSELCHSTVMDAEAGIPGHDEEHAMVTCWACHDAAGLQIGVDDLGQWTTLLPGSMKPYASHNIVTTAPCERCHFVNNPWELPDEVTIPSP